MNKLFFAILLCVSFWGNPAQGDVNDEPIVLVKGGRPRATIVIADKPLPVRDGAGRDDRHSQKTVAEELQQYLEKASGAKLPIIKAADAPASGTLILVGKSSISEQYKLKTPEKCEGLRIVSFPRGIALLGEMATPDVPDNNTDKDVDRGIRHAVYAFLEKYIGYRFYFSVPTTASGAARNGRLDVQPDGDKLGTVNPDKKTITLTGSIDFTDAPVFRQRSLMSAEYDFNATRSGNPDNFNANHSHNVINAWRKYRKTHPEYFLLNKDGSRNFGFLCYSEPGVMEVDLQNIAKWVEEHPHELYINVWPPDIYPGHQGCACPRCRATGRAGYDGRWSNMWFGYVNRIAAEIKKRWPEKRVATGAYTTWAEPPDFPLLDNVYVQLCIHPAAKYTHNYMVKQPEIYRGNLSLVKSWNSKLMPGRLLNLRLYGTNTGTGMPLVYPHVLKRWLNDVKGLIGGYGFDGIYDYHCKATPRANLMRWVWFKLLWNPDFDVDKGIHDYSNDLFGPAGKDIENFFQLMAKRYEKPFNWQNLRRNLAMIPGPIMMYSEGYPPQVLDQLENDLFSAMKKVGLSTDPDWILDENSAFVLRNTGDQPRTYAVCLQPVEGDAVQPSLKWPGGGEIIYKGVLEKGQRLVVESDAKATLFSKDGEAKDVTNLIRGDLPKIPAHTTKVLLYSSPLGAKGDRMRVAMGERAQHNSTVSAENIYQRRLRWFSRFFIVNDMWDRPYEFAQGPLPMGRMTQWWVKHKAPEYKVATTDVAPTADLEADCWKNVESLRLVQSAPKTYGSKNVGFPADQSTSVKMLQDEDNLYVLFQCVQFVLPSEQDQVVVRIYNKTDRFEVACDANGKILPAPPFSGQTGTLFNSDIKGVKAKVDSHYPEGRTINLTPAKAVSVLKETGKTVAVKSDLMTSHWSYGSGLKLFAGSLLQFNIPHLKDNELIYQANFDCYYRWLNPTWPSSRQVYYSPDDGWTAEPSQELALPKASDVKNLVEAGDVPEARSGGDNNCPKGWCTADLTSFLKKDNEGAGKPLTIVTRGGGSGRRGFSISLRENEKPSLKLQVGTYMTDPWWSVMLVIPKSKLGNIPADGNFHVDLARAHNKPGRYESSHYQIVPKLQVIYSSPSPTGTYLQSRIVLSGQK